VNQLSTEPRSLRWARLSCPRDGSVRGTSDWLSADRKAQRARRFPPFSLAALPFAAVLFLSVSGCGRSTSPAPQPTNPSSPGRPALFSLVSDKVGLNFIHDSGARGEYMMPEHIGSGAALLDYDNDGRLDLYLVQNGGPDSGHPNQLFHQEPDGSFQDVTAGSGLDVTGFGMGATAGDVNNDGKVDLFLTEYGNVRLFLNRGQGQFEDVTKAAGIDNIRWATAASFVDYDRDGWLDLVVGNYVDYNPTQKCFDPAGAGEYCGPQNFQNTVSRLYHNLGSEAGSGRVAFEDTTVRSGFARAQGKALGILCADFDGDRWPDIFVADDGIPNRLYINRRDGTFVEEAAQRGLAYNALGSAAGNMGIGLGDVNGDGLFDLFVTHLTFEQHSLWVQGPRGLFSDQVAMCGLASPLMRGTGFGTVLADFDLDGSPDLAVINGTIRRGAAHPGQPLAGLVPFWHPYAQRYQLFLNNGKGRFAEISNENPAFCSSVGVGRGLASGDLNNDGAVDLLAICAGGPAQLFYNVAPRRHHWLTVRALDPQRGDRDAIGAEVGVLASGRERWGLVQPSCSFLVSNDPRVHFGLESATQVDSIRIRWPDGTDEVFPGGPVDRFLALRQGSGRKP
jgi:hypothetical protein